MPVFIIKLTETELCRVVLGITMALETLVDIEVPQNEVKAVNTTIDALNDSLAAIGYEDGGVKIPLSGE